MEDCPRTPHHADIRDPEVTPVYDKWLRLVKEDHDPVFDNFDTFYWWAIASGYGTGARLCRHCLAEPYSPENCYFTRNPIRDVWSPEEKLSIARFNITVEKIRAAHGLPPLGGSTVA